MTVCPPTCRRRCIGRLCGCCIVCAGIGQINGNTAVKPCKLFWRSGGIKLHGRQKSRCKRLCVADTPPGKKKSPAPSADARQKKNPASVGGVDIIYFFSSRSARAAQSSCASSFVKSYSVRSWSASVLLHPPSYRAAALLETSFNMAFPLFRAFALFYSISYCKPY